MADDDADLERTLKMEQMAVDIELKRKQAFWETPRNLVIVIGTLVAATAALAGVLGYKAGSAPPQPIVIQLVQPAAK